MGLSNDVIVQRRHQLTHNPGDTTLTDTSTTLQQQLPHLSRLCRCVGPYFRQRRAFTACMHYQPSALANTPPTEQITGVTNRNWLRCLPGSLEYARAQQRNSHRNRSEGKSCGLNETGGMDEWWQEAGDNDDTRDTTY
jgi:hypothetical protein